MKKERRMIKGIKGGKKRKRDKREWNREKKNNNQRREWRRGVQMKGRGMDACFIHSPLTLL